LPARRPRSLDVSATDAGACHARRRDRELPSARAVGAGPYSACSRDRRLPSAPAIGANPYPACRRDQSRPSVPAVDANPFPRRRPGSRGSRTGGTDHGQACGRPRARASARNPRQARRAARPPDALTSTVTLVPEPWTPAFAGETGWGGGCGAVRCVSNSISGVTGVGPDTHRFPRASDSLDAPAVGAGPYPACSRDRGLSNTPVRSADPFPRRRPGPRGARIGGTAHGHACGRPHVRASLRNPREARRAVRPPGALSSTATLVPEPWTPAFAGEAVWGGGCAAVRCVSNSISAMTSAGPDAHRFRWNVAP